MANFCNKCGKPVKQENRFCIHCGAKLIHGPSQTPHKNKRDKVMKKNGGGFGGSLKWIFGVAIVLVVGVILWDKLSSPANTTIESQPVVSSGIDYQALSQASGSVVQMVDVNSRIQNGKIIIPVDLVKKNKFVAFKYTNGSQTVPLLSYIAPDGKLVTAVSLCEPCRSTRFHISGSNIVCNTCGSSWDIQTLQPVSGACGAYPPQVIPSNVVGNMVQIDVKTVSNWQPRV